MKRLARFFVLFVILFAILFGVWWVGSAPPDYLQVAPAFRIGEPPASILAVRADGDPIAEGMETLAPQIRGYDDVILQEKLGRAFLTGRDGWVWRMSLATGVAERFADIPLMAAGGAEVPGDDDRLYFCASHLYETAYPEGERVGLYELEISSKTVKPLLLDVPLPPPIAPPRAGNQGTVFTRETETRLAVADMNETNSRPIAFCNDLAISDDGKRVYFSEPYPYEGASMGGGAIGEAITLGKNGRLWRFDIEERAVALVAQDYNFIDGVLPDLTAEGPEESILVTETTKFRILRFYLRGEKAGQDEVVWENLPAMADALERDAQGRIWVGLIKQRSGLITWAHANPWIKPLMLRLPLEMLPVPTVTGVLVLSPDASTPLWYTEHPGTHVTDIAAAIPGTKHLYLANFSEATPGIHRIPNPLETP